MNINYMAIPGIERNDYYIQIACGIFKVTKTALLSKDRYKEVVQCRQALMYFFRIKKKYTWYKSGELVNRDHATVKHSISVIENIKTDSKDFRDKVDEFMKIMKE